MHTDVLYALSEHHLMENLASGHANKGVIHLLGPVRPERLYIAPSRVVTIESGTGHRSVLSSGGNSGAARPLCRFVRGASVGGLRRSPIWRHGGSWSGGRESTSLG